MRKIIFSLTTIAVLLGACKESETPGLTTNQQSLLVTNYANILEAGYQDSYNAAVALQTAITTLTTTPSAANLTAAQNAWRAAREPYMQTEMARFYGGPIDGDTGDGLLNSWPLDEGYIDYLSGDSHGYSAYTNPDFTTGIINMTTDFPTIDANTLINDNQPDGGTTNANGDNVSVSVGYHAIEFLLWGQDDTPASQNKPGQRSYGDYLTDPGTASAPNGGRRAQYLQVVTQLVVDNLQDMVDAWAPNTNNYRKTFEADPAIAIANMFNGIGRLAKGELAGERMGVPLALHAQEQEHSCFSDNTHRDVRLDMQGIVNIYYGTYTRTDGTTVISGLGLSDYVKALSADDDTKMKTLLANAQTSLKAIEDNKPFDWLIDGTNSTGNQIVQNGVNDVSAVADWVSQIAHDLKLSDINIPDENP